jgi:hypothetical protein
MMQKANVRHGKSRVVRRGELPYIRRSRSLYKVSVVHVTVSLSMEKKSKEEAKKKQKKRIHGEKGVLWVAKIGV